MKNYFTLFDLQLFAQEGGQEGAAGDTAQAGAPVNSAAVPPDAEKKAQPGEKKEAPLAAARGKAARRALNNFNNIKYGRSADAGADGIRDAETGAPDPQTRQNDENGSNPPEAGREAAKESSVSTENGKSGSSEKASFEELIKGEYREQFNERMQSIIDKRFKETKSLEAQREKIAPILDVLATKYGVRPDNYEKLAKAIQDDDSYYEQEALEKGVTVESLKVMKKMERENAEIKEALKRRDEAEGARQNYMRLTSQMEELKKIYPSFDIKSEMQNQKFAQLVRNPAVDLRTAYEVVHRDEIIPAAMQFAAKQIERKITNNIIAGGSRPSENGLSSGSATVIKSDPKNLSKDDRREIRRRVSQGEKIFW